MEEIINVLCDLQESVVSSSIRKRAGELLQNDVKVDGHILHV